MERIGDFYSNERRSCPRTAPPGARRRALATAQGPAPGGAAPFAATRFVVAVHFTHTLHWPGKWHWLPALASGRMKSSLP